MSYFGSSDGLRTRNGMNDRLEPRIRILLGSSIAIGPGKAALLEAIGDTGSIAAAGRRMGMSYRRAWLLAKTMNACVADRWSRRRKAVSVAAVPASLRG